MTDELDDALRDLLGTPAAPPSAVLRHRRETLMQHIRTADDARPARADTDTRETGPIRRRRRLAALVVAPVVTAGLAAAGWNVLRDPAPATQASAFSCVSTRGDGVVSVMPNDGSDPVATCADLWRTGGMEADVRSAPPLVACVDKGLVKVIEGADADACVAVGAVPWAEQSAYAEAGAAIEAVRSDLEDRFVRTGDGCPSVDDFTSRLDGRLNGWTYDVDQVEPSLRCYDVGSIDPVHHSILIIGVPGDTFA